MKVRKFKKFRKYFQIILKNIKKGKWIYNIKLFKVNLLNKASEGDLAAYVLNGEWDLLGNKVNFKHKAGIRICQKVYFCLHPKMK